MKIFIAFLLFFLSFPSFALAHSSISPTSAGTSQYQTFTLSVPTEKEIPTTSIRLLIPDMLDRVTPFVKPGWTIEMKKEGEKVTEITWSGGEIPAGQKDIFLFTGRTPEKDANLIWKVYQTYQDGEIVAWDQDPKGEDVEKPYSITAVSSTIPAAGQESAHGKVEEKPVTSAPQNSSLPISVVALALSVIALGSAMRRK